MRRLLLIVLLIVLAGYGVIAVLRGPARNFTASLLEEQNDATPTEQVRGLSFADDSDHDGLSDGKEAIYGTDADRPDTDGDSHQDGDEVKNGNDPTRGGESKITDNENLMGSLTVRYFEWARTIANIDDPQLNDQAVGQFLEIEGLTKAKIPTVDDSEMKLTEESGQEALKKYFGNLGAVRLPDNTASYVDLADEVIRNKRSELLDDVVAGLSNTYEALRNIPTPKEAHDLHREQLALLKALKNLFSDLYSIERDPVMLMRDIAWGTDLLEQSVELEKKRMELAGTLPPDEGNTQAPN